MNSFIDTLLADIEKQRVVEARRWRRGGYDEVYDFGSFLANERFCPGFHAIYQRFEKYIEKSKITIPISNFTDARFSQFKHCYDEVA